MQHCLRPGCPSIVHRGYCARHRPQEADRVDAPARQLYRGPRWRELRAAVLKQHPHCPGRGDGRACGEPTVDVHHREPHHGDPARFYDPRNLVALCHRCHPAIEARERRTR